jgi:hypothetical protein
MIRRISGGLSANLCVLTVALVALASGPPTAQADEISHLRANQELLQRRLDQLAQAPAGPGAPTLAGSFPRSFLIPGTDTSVRVGGQANGRVTWYLRGVSPSADLFGQGNANADRTEGGGGTGNLAAIPLNSGAAAGPAASHSKSAAFFISGKSTRLFFDARTPTAWGTAQAYAEFDFATSNNNVLLNGQFTVVPNNPARFRQGYAALGPFLLGTATGSFVDNDSDIETIDFGGQVGSTGRGRVPQFRFTWTSPWPGITAVMAAEQPDSEFESPNGSFVSSYTSAVTTAACGNGASLAGAPAGSLTTTTGNPINVACAPLAALFDAAQAREPTGVFVVRYNQPWGHLRLAAVLRDSVLNDGRIDKTWIGYGGSISGDVKPFPDWSPKDDIGFSVALGEALGGYIPNSRSVATNWGGVLGGQNPTIFNGMTFGGCTTCSFNTTSAAGLAARAAYDALVRGKTITAFSAKLGYVHWWTPELRTNMDFSMMHQDVSSIINTPGISGSAGVNKELAMSHINLLWSPVAFVTTGVEYSWGHRVVRTNAKGDSHIIQGLLRVSF